MKLAFGFEANPYTRVASVGKGPRGQSVYGRGTNAARVAKDLELRYKIVETFFQLEEDNIVEALEEAFAEDIEEVMMGQRVSKKGISDKHTRQVERNFRDSLNSQRFDGMIPGVPTLASIRGVDHRKTHAFAKRGPRPSFVDTGNYRDSFRVWVEDLED